MGADRVLKRLSLTRVGEMDLEQTNGGTDGLPRISDRADREGRPLRASGLGAEQGGGRDGRREQAAHLRRHRSANQRSGAVSVSDVALLLQDVLEEPKLIDWEWIGEN